MVPQGAHESGFWWNPAGPAAHVTVDERAERHEVELLVEGSPVQLSVQDPSGRRVQGMDVEVFREGVSHGTWSVWDGGLHAETTGAQARLPSLMLPPGQNKVEVRVPGIGSGAVELDLPGDGVVVTRTVQLRPDDSDRAAQRDALEKRLLEGLRGR